MNLPPPPSTPPPSVPPPAWPPPPPPPSWQPRPVGPPHQTRVGQYGPPNNWGGQSATVVAQPPVSGRRRVSGFTVVTAALAVVLTAGVATFAAVSLQHPGQTSGTSSTTGTVPDPDAGTSNGYEYPATGGQSSTTSPYGVGRCNGYGGGCANGNGGSTYTNGDATPYNNYGCNGYAGGCSNGNGGYTYGNGNGGTTYRNGTGGSPYTNGDASPYYP